MNVYPEFIDKDRPVLEGEEAPYIGELEFETEVGRIIGMVLVPNHKPGEKHPAIVLLHGFPGHNSLLDIGHALRRAGFVVFNPFAPGAWGSGGYYTFDGLIKAASAIVNYAASEECQEKYHICPDNIFLAGHSMGGYTCVNTMRRVPALKAGVCLMPFDYPWFFENGQLETIKGLFTLGTILKQETETSMYENALANYEETAFSKAAEDLKDRNMLFIGGAKDDVAPVDTMIEPLYNKIKELGGKAEYILYDTDHSFNDCRFKVIKTIADYICPMVD